MKFAPEAWPFVAPFVVLALALAAFGRLGWAGAAAVVGVLVLLFFRDPRRRFAGDPSVVLAPADGLITRVDTIDDPELGPGRFQRIVTFLSVFDVHVQRTPAEGEVIAARYSRGRKVAAFRPEADLVNEKHLTVLRRDNGDVVGVAQIAGLLARRVVCDLKLGDRRPRGERMGIIKFGSRVDLTVPATYTVLVKKGDRVRNGETPMARPAETPVQ